MSQLMYYDTGSSQWLPVVVGAQGIQGLLGNPKPIIIAL